MKTVLSFCILLALIFNPLEVLCQSYYVNIIDFGINRANRIEVYDPSQTLPRVTIQGQDTLRIYDCRMTKDSLFAYFQGINGLDNRYYFLDRNFDVVDSLTHVDATNPAARIDPHCVYKDDSMLIYVVQYPIVLQQPITFPEYGSITQILDNIIVVKKRGQTILEFGNYNVFPSKYIEIITGTGDVYWDVAHINSVEWMGDGIIVSSLAYGLYKIDLEGNVIWKQDDMRFVGGDIPRKQHDFVYHGDGLYSVFSNGDDTTDLFAATFRISGDSVIYENIITAPIAGQSFAMGNYQVGGILNYGTFPYHLRFLDTGRYRQLGSQEYAYRAENHTFHIPADIEQAGQNLIYTPLNEYSTITWSTGDIGTTIPFTEDTVTVTEITPRGYKVTTVRKFTKVGINEIGNQGKPNSQPYNLMGQPVPPKGLHIVNGKVYFTPE